jgi:mannose-6-phosphate isomerase-like protein (cupin superfamily)
MTPPSTSPSPYPSLSVSPSDGAALTFVTVGTSAALRVRPHEWTLLRVIDGVVRLTVGNVERVLHAREEAIVDPGQPHRIAAVSGEARYVVGFRSSPLR